MLQNSQSDKSIEVLRDTGAATFVINLCASTTPVTLAHPASAELKRFTFFVTRRREEGRERFRLHMGYFPTLAEAEAMLAAVRDVYPAAWAGPAPENRAAAARAARPSMTVVPTPTPTSLPTPVAAAAVPATVAPPAPVSAPVIASAPPPPPVPVTTVVETPKAVSAPEPAAIVLALEATDPASLETVPVTAAAMLPVAAPAPAPVELESMSNVKEVLAQLADEPQKNSAAPMVKKLQAPQPPAAKPVAAKPIAVKPAPAQTIAVAKPVSAPKPVPVIAKAPVRPTVVPTAAPAPRAPTKEAAALSPSETLRVLEASARQAKVAPAPPASAPVAPLPAKAPGIDFASSSSANNIRVLTPDDTQTLRDIKLDAQRNAPASYAVQLVWAVQPINMEALPHLAIFDAYTLYHVEGNRQGRRWYGLRLGFFTDAGAAKQVAQYVRSEYSSVAVVPVTGREKDGARAPTLSAATIQQPAIPRNEAPSIPTVKPLDKPVAAANLEGFELLPDLPAAAKRDLDDAIAGSTPGAKHAPAKSAPRATGKAPGKRAVARPNRMPSPPGAPQPLESTLEILGASTLTIDESREVVNDAAARRPSPTKEKPGRFARLLNRLSDKGG